MIPEKAVPPTAPNNPTGPEGPKHVDHTSPDREPALHLPTAPSLRALINGVADGTVAFDELSGALMPLLRHTGELPAEIALELSTRLIDLEAKTVDDDQLFALVDSHGAAALALAKSGQILAANGAAASLFHLNTGDGVSALGITRDEFEQFVQRLSQTPGSSLIRGHRPASGRRTVPVVLSGTYRPGYRAFVLKALQNYWPDTVDKALEDVFALSASEREVLSRLSQGRNSEEIARERHRSVGTVRQQVKSILHKLGVSSQLEAATLAAAAAATATAIVETSGRAMGSLPRGPREEPLQLGSFFRSERLVGHRRFGDRTGKRILLIHGPSFGAGEYPEDRRWATRFGLDVHAIERPGYGRTYPPSAGEDILDCHTADILHYLDASKINNVTILAHEVGLIPALQLAHSHPERVRAIVAVSAAPPFLELEQIHAMPEHQSIFIQAARRAPWLARLMTKLLTIRTRRLGVERWTDVIFQGVQPDAGVMKRQALRAGIIATYSFYLGQRGAGFELDLSMMLADWGHLVSEATVPVTLLHGADNLTTPPAYLDLFRRLNPAIQMELVHDAGLTLAVSHPELIYRWVAQP